MYTRSDFNKCIIITHLALVGGPQLVIRGQVVWLGVRRGVVQAVAREVQAVAGRAPPQGGVCGGNNYL